MKIYNTKAITILCLLVTTTIANAKNNKSTFYYKSGASSLSTRIVLNELNVEYQDEAVNLANHTLESTKEDFYKINEKGSVPAVKLTNGDLITEGAVIMQYFADKDPEHKMLPQVGSIERYRVLEMLNITVMDIYKPIIIIFHNKLSDDDKKSIITELKKSLSFMDKKLTDKKYLVGDNFTISDSYLFNMLNILPWLDIDINEWKNLSKFHKDIKQRPSVAKSLKDEGLTK
jgi:glutathione S-transferase